MGYRSHNKYALDNITLIINIIILGILPYFSWDPFFLYTRIVAYIKFIGRVHI
jgi:hypothetical protein